MMNKLSRNQVRNKVVKKCKIITCWGSRTCDPLTPVQSKHSSPFSDFLENIRQHGLQNTSKNRDPGPQKARPQKVLKFSVQHNDFFSISWPQRESKKLRKIIKMRSWEALEIHLVPQVPPTWPRYPLGIHFSSKIDDLGMIFWRFRGLCLRPRFVNSKIIK